LGYETARFEGGSLDNGIRPNLSNFNPEIVQSTNSSNITSGIQLGQGPRYGMAPIPGHSTTGQVTTQPCGLMQSELGTGTNNYKNRVKVLGLLPVTLGTYADPTVKKVHYVWAVVDSSNLLSFVFAGDFDGVAAYRHINDIARGLQPSVTMLFSSPLSTLDPSLAHFSERNPTNTTADLQSYLSVAPSLYYASVTSLTVSGKEVPMQWALGRAFGTADATTTALPNFVKPDPTVSTDHFMGLPSFFNTRNFKQSVRQMTFYDLDASYSLVREYLYQVDPDESTFVQTLNQNNTVPNITGIGAGVGVPRLDGAAPVYADVKTVLYNDAQSTINSGYTLLAASPGKAVMAFVQDWQRNHDGTLPQWIDPTNPVFVAQTVQTNNMMGSTAPYQENGVSKATCWKSWPSWDQATPTAKDSAAARDGTIHVTLGEANSGILSKDTTYEIAFSVYDKQLNLECNVGSPARITTDTDDFVSFSLLRDAQSGGQFVQKGAAGYEAYSPFPRTFNTGTTPVANTPLNYLEYRVYYRQLGSFEWLPALFIDAAKYWYYPSYQVLWACEGPIAALPGAQVGGFNDYSPLPKDGYTDVKVFQNRLFWLSPQNLIFSYQNNGFAYPLRNSLPCPKGEFRGMLPHYFFGQAQQEGRMVVFGSQETYSGRFTGSPFQSPVQVSPNTVATFPLDGSDFVIESRNTVTAFSSRSAIVAEGELYYWGPTGIYRDSGVDVPEKVSGGIEPDIFILYDPNKTDEIHAQYMEETKEIIWYYPAKDDTSGATQGLVLNRMTKEFFYVQFDGKVDWSSKVLLDKSDVSRNTNGTRNVIGVRETASATVQRAVFFDYRNRAGDVFPGTELLVREITQTDPLYIRLHLAKGYDQTNFGLVAVGDTVTVSQGSDYSGQVASDDPVTAGVKDMIAQITAIGGTYPNQYLDVLLPTNFPVAASYYVGTLTPDRYFPIWIPVLNGIRFTFETNIWIPGGMKYWARWLFLHLIFKLDLLPSKNLVPPNAGAQTINLAYRSPIAKDWIENTLTFVDNSRGNFQVYSQLKTTNQASEGQGIQIKLSGLQNGTSWVLQYLGADAMPIDGDQLQLFEG
jgi:hypothetical protein